VLDVRGKSSITDYLILVNATSEPHAKALKTSLDAKLKEAPLFCVVPICFTAAGCLALFFLGDRIYDLLAPLAKS